MRTFETVMLTGESRPPIRRHRLSSEDLKEYCAQARTAGITHLQVNLLPDPYHQVLLEQPDNYYAWFADYGPALDQFVSSDLNRGLYLEAHLARNLAYLHEVSDAVINHGLKPVLMLCEPRFVPERFFACAPELRGPRVDNPIFSDTPWYALCVHHPRVQKHYRQMLAELMRQVPSLAGISIFTSDSGSGFCHSQKLYAGPNGCYCCRHLDVGKRIAEFLGVLCEVGRPINPDFRVSLASGIEGKERAGFLSHAGRGVTGEVQGAWSWIGGLEDQWAWHQHGRQLEHVGYEQAREERLADYRQRLAAVVETGKEPVAICSMPTDGFYLPIRYVPHPFQNHEILQSLREMGVRHLNCKGALNPASLVKYEINRAAFAEFMGDPHRSADEIVRKIAMQWVGQAHVEALVSAWKHVDLAHRHRTMWLWPLARLISFMPGPIVPDFHSLTAEEVAFADHLALAQIDRLAGRHRLDVLRMDETERAWVISHTRREVLPALEKALGLLETELAGITSDGARQCFAEQIRHVRHCLLWRRSTQNWCEAGCWIAPGQGRPLPKRSLTEIIDDEIDVSHRLIELLKDGGDDLYAFGPTDALLYVRGPGFADQLADRIKVMKRHRNDSPRPISNPSDCHSEADAAPESRTLRKEEQ